jgi:cell division protein FtsI/penicillin-binding protein 2
MLSAYNTVANGGVYVAPHLVKGFIGPKGHLHPIQAPPPHRVVSLSVASEMTSMLEQVVAAGTGTAAAVPPYAVAGKTGTAQFDGPHGYVTGRTVASFAGFAPAQDPAVTVMVVVFDTPDYGAQASAPAFSTITRDALTDLKVPADGPQPPGLPTALPQPLGAKSAA